MSFYSELKRRNVLRVAAGYIVSSWLLIQVAETIFPLFGYGDGPARIAVIVLTIGFVPVLIVSWVFELTPEGWKKDSDADHGPVAGAQSGKRFDYIIMLVLAVSLAYFAFDKFVLSKGREQVIAETAREEALLMALETIRNNKSIAVLPFVDMSKDQDQEYFADGMTEELLDELAQLEGLNVTGRTSSFAFKGHNLDLRDIGEQLGVDYILEGSVRKQDDELRITAQLINTQDGSHMWSYTKDSSLGDTFVIQDDIARSVAGKLSIELDVEGRNHLPGAGTESIDAYDEFLEGRAALRGRGGTFALAKVHYERAIELDPEYAEAVAELGATIGMASMRLPSVEARAAQERGRDLVAQAIEIDPTYARAYDYLSRFQWARGDYVGAAEMHEEYSALARADVIAGLGSRSVFAHAGRLSDAVKITELEHRNDPLRYLSILELAEQNIQLGRNKAALAALADAERLYPPPSQGSDLRRMFLSISIGEADGIREALANYAIADPRVATLVKAILDEFDATPNAVLEVMRRIYENDANLTGEGRMVVASMAAHYDDPEFALEIMTGELSVNMLRTNRLWYTFFSEMRSLPGFKTLAEHLGFVAYWRKYGWADTCRPLGNDDFECS